MTVEFNIIDYVHAHGKNPKGKGCWAFSTNRQPKDDAIDLFMTPYMSYTDAKKRAKAAFVNSQTIYVLG